VRLAVAQHVGYDAPVGEAQDVVEILAGVFGITAGVWPAEHRDGALLPEQVAQRIGELGRLGKGPNEQHVQIGRKLLQEILETRIAHEGHLVTLLLAPDADDLRHDARQIGVHQATIQRRVGTLRD
jgi:hypothetical protein